MNVAKLALSVCLSVSVLACGESSADNAGAPADGAGGKADEVEGDGCEEIESEYAACSAATDTATCNLILRDSYPDGGSCCVRDTEPYGFCAAYVEASDCDAVAADYDACNENDGEADCDQYVRDFYPEATACCEFDGYDDVCALFTPEDSGSCAAIAADYEACNNNGGEADCEDYLQEFYPWGVNCCFLDEYPDVCEAYSGGVSCDDVNADYLACTDVADEDMCGIISTDTYPDAGEACCGGEADYEVCSAYGEPLTCDDINEEYLLCLSVEDEAMCDIIIVDSYPDGGACCGHDFEDYQVCGAYG